MPISSRVMHAVPIVNAGQAVGHAPVMPAAIAVSHTSLAATVPSPQPTSITSPMPPAPASALPPVPERPPEPPEPPEPPPIRRRSLSGSRSESYAEQPAIAGTAAANTSPASTASDPRIAACITATMPNPSPNPGQNSVAAHR
jgi:hypothetical protein